MNELLKIDEARKKHLEKLKDKLQEALGKPIIMFTSDHEDFISVFIWFYTFDDKNYKEKIAEMKSYPNGRHWETTGAFTTAELDTIEEVLFND